MKSSRTLLMGSGPTTKAASDEASEEQQDNV